MHEGFAPPINALVDCFICSLTTTATTCYPHTLRHLCRKSTDKLIHRRIALAFEARCGIEPWVSDPLCGESRNDQFNSTYRVTVLTLCAAENSRLATKAAPVTTLTPGIINATVRRAIFPAFTPETLAVIHLN